MSVENSQEIKEVVKEKYGQAALRVIKADRRHRVVVPKLLLESRKPIHHAGALRPE
jgi:hypothetical protein